MPALKKIHRDGIPAALEKAIRYRLLNEPLQAESICRDILAIDSKNTQAWTTLLLALTDQFPDGPATVVDDANACIEQLTNEYEKAYYSGIICERRGYAWYQQKTPGWGPAVHSWLTKAMEWYEKAESLAPSASNMDPILRWNTCARLMEHESQIEPLDEAPVHPIESE